MYSLSPSTQSPLCRSSPYPLPYRGHGSKIPDFFLDSRKKPGECSASFFLFLGGQKTLREERVGKNEKK